MSTPSITPAQIIALALAFVAIIAAGLLPIDAATRDAVVELAKTVILGLIGGDAILRIGRQFNIDNVLRAKAVDALAKATAATASTPTTDDSDDETPPSNTTEPSSRRIDVGMALVALLTALAALAFPLVTASTAGAAEPNLMDGRAHVIVGRPIAQPNAPLRRIYPTNVAPRGGVTLRSTRASMPRFWETYELDVVRAWAARNGWRTSETVRGGIDTTPHLTGKEYRVDRTLRIALNATARAGGGTCTIISGWRDSLKQLKLWLMYLAGTGNPANRPGTSRHEAPYRMPALAADVYCGASSTTFWAWSRSKRVAPFAKSRGLRMPYQHEEWHVERTGTT